MAEEKVKFDAKLAEGVAYFEQMLQVMPDDRTTLEFLVVAYDQLGQAEKGRRALVSLARVLLKERDIAAAEQLLPRLEACGEHDAQAAALKIRALSAPAPDLTPEKAAPVVSADSPEAVYEEAVRAEMVLVDALVQEGVLTEEDAKLVKGHLQGVPFAGRLFLVSALAILEKENPGLGEKCIACLADAANTPPIPFEAFDLNRDLVRVFPEPIVRIRGAVPFAKLGSTLLVTLPNPHDEVLLEYLVKTAACPVRFYLADPRVLEEKLEAFYAPKEVG